MKKENLPQCVGFIMDGNRRFAKEKNLATLEGHQAGTGVFFEVATWVKEMNIPHAVFYAFSTENWNRTQVEVDYLLKIFKIFILQMLDDNKKNQIRVRFIGRRTDFSPSFQDLMKKLEQESVQYIDTTVWVALSYGGRTEILEACNEAIKIGQSVDEASFSKLLYTAQMPDPDLVIRTGGEQRLSNFLPWQSVYSELFFTSTYWPAFTKVEFARILTQYGERQRRRGR